MNCLFICLACTFLLVIAFTDAYHSTLKILTSSTGSSSTLFAHHPEFKIIKKIMHKRPKKHRLSDINRRNVNHGKCISKVENSPPDFVYISAEDYAKVRQESLKFWEIGDPEEPWLEITEEDMVTPFSQNRDPPPPGSIIKRLPLLRSGTC